MLWWIISSWYIPHCSYVALQTHIFCHKIISICVMFLLILIYFLCTPLHEVAFYSLNYPICLFPSYIRMYVCTYIHVHIICSTGMYVHFRCIFTSFMISLADCITYIRCKICVSMPSPHAVSFVSLLHSVKFILSY